jgi:hypothetical protein
MNTSSTPVCGWAGSLPPGARRNRHDAIVRPVHELHALGQSRDGRRLPSPLIGGPRLEGRLVELKPGQGFVVPKGLVHRTRASENSVILMVQGAGIVPTGDSAG